MNFKENHQTLLQNSVKCDKIEEKEQNAMENYMKNSAEIKHC